MNFTDRMAYRLLRTPELYKFRPLSTPGDMERIRAIIEENRVYFPRPTEVNDPWDCKLRFRVPEAADTDGLARCIRWLCAVDRRLSPDKPEGQRRAEVTRLTADPSFTIGILKQLALEMQRAVYTKYRIFSLSSICDHPLLWSHYADAHRGICVVFSTNRTEFGFAERVTYQPNLPELPIDSDDGRELVVATFLTKAQHWDYEEEFRIIVDTTAPAGAETTPLTPEGELIFPEANLLGVIYGCRASDESKRRIEEMLGRRRLAVNRVQAIQDDNRYGLRFEALNGDG